MRYAIIAAGEGSRLSSEGIRQPKPLVEVGGECLADRLIRIFMNHDADEIVVICNDHTPQVAQHLAALQRRGLQGHRVPLRLVAKTTPSSMHSFFEISSFLTGGPFVLTTVDTIFLEDEFSRFVSDFAHSPADGLMGVTSYIDDERPLYVETDAAMRITAFLDRSDHCPYISAGIYALQPSAIASLHRCMARGESRLRNFQRALVAEGRLLRAWPFSKVFDVDHADDIRKAELFLKAGGDGRTD